MTRRPPRSTLFPTRRSSDLPLPPTTLTFVLMLVVLELAVIAPDRSEEHTSELQSRSDLVCRLLLEKKKNNKTHSTPSSKFIFPYVYIPDMSILYSHAYMS